MSRFSSTLQRFAAGYSGVELIYAPHCRWPLNSDGCERRSADAGHKPPRSLAISVLDSSFNPPTMAHLALSRISLPPIPDSQEMSSNDDFDARLLLFSIKNADKVLKPGDATHSQRLEMMVLLAGELEKAQSGKQDSRNVAIAVCQEPTFAGKSTALGVFLRERLATISPRLEPLPCIQLTFLLGFDTLERLFAPRYYGSESAMRDALRALLTPSGDNSRVICARRSTGASYCQSDTGVLDAASEFIGSGSVVLVDIEEDVQALSSSEVREDTRGSFDSWKHKVPMPVAEYIRENRLYGYSV